MRWAWIKNKTWGGIIKNSDICKKKHRIGFVYRAIEINFT